MTESIIVTNLLPGEWQYIGEGNRNIVLRIPKDQCVLRLIKEDPNEPNQSVFSTVEFSLKYVDEVMAPLIGNEFVPKGELVRINGRELEKVDQFRPEFRKLKKLNPNSCVGVKLPDCTTCISSKYDGFNKISSVFAVEIKPKMGFLTSSANKTICSEKKSCTYQLMQRQKLFEKRIEEMNSYCPLDLFSGQCDRMKFALKSLLKNPQNNLRLFVNGATIYGENMSRSGLDAFFKEFITSDSCWDQREEKFCDLIILILLQKLIPEESDDDYHENQQCGCGVSEIIPAIEKGVFKHCILGRILTAQKLDTFTEDLQQTYEEIKTLMKEYPLKIQNILIYGLQDKNENMPNITEDIKIKFNSLARFLASATAKDCSIMITVQRVEKRLDSEIMDNLIEIGQDCYAFNITVLDLDMKPHQRILQYCSKKQY